MVSETSQGLAPTEHTVTRKRMAVFALLTAVLCIVLVTAALLAVDVFYVHPKFDEVIGLNIWGYRGPVVGRKEPGEQRVVVVGGSTALGYGVLWSEAISAVLQDLLSQEQKSGAGEVSVVNLAYNNEGSYSLQFTLQDYDYLEYDAVLFYSGYNNLKDFNPQVHRHKSPIFRLTGYYPLLPLVMSEKAMAIRYGGDLDAAYRDDKTVFRPGLAERATASALEQANAIGEALGRQLARAIPDAEGADSGLVGDTCGRWPRYCDEMYVAVKSVLDRGKRALVVSQPLLRNGQGNVGEKHREQQRLVVAYLRQRLGEDPKLRFVDLRSALNLTDPLLAWDGVHLTVAGNRQVAERLVEPVRQLLQ